MIIIQFTGLSGAGKSTIAKGVEKELKKRKLAVEIIDGDEYRKHLCKDLGFSEADRKENIRRLGVVAVQMANKNSIVLISAINPYEQSRMQLHREYKNVKTVWVNCNLEELIKRDTKGLYKRALLEDSNPEKIHNLTGINDLYEQPVAPDLLIHTDKEKIEESVKQVVNFILRNLPV
jgi:adenylylsulfate kinase